MLLLQQHHHQIRKSMEEVFLVYYDYYSMFEIDCVWIRQYTRNNVVFSIYSKTSFVSWGTECFDGKKENFVKDFYLLDN